MADWNLKVTIVSAANLADVRNFGIMKVYAQVSINEVEQLTLKSPVDLEGRTSPVWNFNADYEIKNTLIVERDEFLLVIKLYCERTFQEDKYVGEVKLKLKSLFESRNTYENSVLEFEVDREDENGVFGTIKLSYCFSKVGRPVTSTVREEKSFSVPRVVIKGAASLLAEIFLPGSSDVIEFMLGD